MAVKDITDAQAESLRNPAGQRHAISGIKYPQPGEQPWWVWLYQALKHIGDVCAGWARVADDDSAGMTVRIAPFRLPLNGKTLIYSGGTKSLSAFNNDVAYVWAEDDGAGNAQISAAAAGTGWPSTPHIKLAEVTLASGVVSGDVVDRSQEHKLGVAGYALPGYDLSIETQGDTGTPSTILIQRRDEGGNAIAKVSYLRVRVCDEDDYPVATNATIAAGTNTTEESGDEITADKDLILKSHTDGSFRIDLSNATEETVTLRIGAAPLSNPRADYDATLDVEHAAP